jgi:hypothetical protein
MKTGDPEVVVVLNRLAITVACLVAVIRWDCTPLKINRYTRIPCWVAAFLEVTAIS